MTQQILDGISRGERALAKERFRTHDEAKKRMRRWLVNDGKLLSEKRRPGERTSDNQPPKKQF